MTCSCFRKLPLRQMHASLWDTKPNTENPIFPNSDLVMLCEGQLVVGAWLPRRLLSLQARHTQELGVQLSFHHHTHPHYPGSESPSSHYGRGSALQYITIKDSSHTV